MVSMRLMPFLSEKSKKNFLRLVAVLFLAAGLSGCSSFLVGSVVDPTVRNLQRQTDLALVCDGAPAYLLMLDSLIVSDPRNENLLITATQAYVSYASAMEECGKPGRAAALSDKAKKYGLALLSLLPEGQGMNDLPLGRFEQRLASVGSRYAPMLFWGGYGWASWIRAQNGAPLAMADLPKVERIMLRVVELDETLFHGGAHLFLGFYHGIRPPALGGNPALSRDHFEKALAIGKREFLPAQVAYAETYAKATFNRKLFERLLHEVLDFPLEKRPDLALSNQLAKRKAKALLDKAEDIF